MFGHRPSQHAGAAAGSGHLGAHGSPGASAQTADARRWWNQEPNLRDSLSPSEMLASAAVTLRTTL